MSESEQSGAGRREVAYRVFAAEFEDADFSYSESDEERAPNYVITPTGARINRLFVVGVLTEVEEVSEDVLRARVVDPTGAFVLYAGQYQPDEQAFLDGADTPAFVAVTGKARTFQPEDSNQVFTSVRPETISEVDADTRDRWSVQTAEQTIERVGQMATAHELGPQGDQLRSTLTERGVDEGLAAGIALAIEHYDTSPAYLQAVRDMAVDVARVVAGELDEVEPVSIPPNATGDADLDALAAAETGEDLSADVAPEATTPSTSTEEAERSDSAAETASAGTAGNDSETTAQVEAGTSTDSEPEAVSADSRSESTGGSEDVGPATDTTTEDVDTSTESAPTEKVDTGDESSAAEEDIGDFEPGEFELDEAEREEIEAEYGTEFQSGTEVDEPGEADIETPEPEEMESGSGTVETEPAGEGESTAVEAERPAETHESGRAEEPTADDGDEDGDEEEENEDDQTEAEAVEEIDEDDEAVEDGDLEDAAVDVMGELDEGDGAARSDVIDAVVERYGASPADVEDAIQDALMDGRCYEPDDSTLKPI